MAIIYADSASFNSIVATGSFSGSVVGYVPNSQTASFATTGSNSFNGNQTITGSVILSGSTGGVTEFTVIGDSILSGSTAISGSLNVSSTVTAVSFVGNGSGLTGVGGGISQGKVVAIATGMANLF